MTQIRMQEKHQKFCDQKDVRNSKASEWDLDGQIQTCVYDENRAW